MKMTTDFAMLIHDFMTRYLVATRNVSQNTVLSYRDSYVLLLHCLNECYGLKPENLKVQDVSPDRVKSFLEWLEENMIPYYPLGVYKDKTAEKEAK